MKYMIAERVQNVRLVGIMTPPLHVHLYRFLQFNIQVTYAFHWESYLFYNVSFSEVCTVYGVLQRCNVLLSFSHCDFSDRTWKMKVTKEWGDFAAA